jgi:hypothetical protein
MIVFCEYDVNLRSSLKHNLKAAFTLDVSPSSLVEIDRRFRSDLLPTTLRMTHAEYTSELTAYF